MKKQGFKSQYTHSPNLNNVKPFTNLHISPPSRARAGGNVAEAIELVWEFSDYAHLPRTGAGAPSIFVAVAVGLEQTAEGHSTVNSAIKAAIAGGEDLLSGGASLIVVQV